MAGAKGKSGGRRPGGGRKPKAFTLLKARLQEEKQADAEYAFALYAGVMRDAAQPLNLRLDCADWIAKRVLGLPKEPIQHSGSVALTGALKIEPYDYDTAIAAVAGGPGGDSTPPGTPQGPDDGAALGQDVPI